jgi:uncharacterized coiled-coil protein SlyX
MKGCFAMEILESRVTDLEIQISHQIRMLEELNSVIILQQKKIERVEKINSFLIQSLKTSSTGEEQILFDNNTLKPPHY